MGRGQHDVPLPARQNARFAHDGDGVDLKGDHLVQDMAGTEKLVHHLEGLGTEGIIHHHQHWLPLSDKVFVDLHAGMDSRQIYFAGVDDMKVDVRSGSVAVMQQAALPRIGVDAGLPVANLPDHRVEIIGNGNAQVGQRAGAVQHIPDRVHIGADDVHGPLMQSAVVQLLLDALRPQRGVFMLADHLPQRRGEIDRQFVGLFGLLLHDPPAH